MATFHNNKKKDWFSHKTGLVFVHGHIFKDRSENSTTFKMELFATTGNGRVYNQWSVVTQISLQAKLKLNENVHSFEGCIRYNFLFCRHVLNFF